MCGEPWEEDAVGGHRVRLLDMSDEAALSAELTRLDVAEEWAAHMARKGRVMPLRVEKVRGKAASVLKQHMLSAGGECALGRQVADFDDTPAAVVLLGTRRHYTEVIRKLRAQPFGLAQIAEELAAVLDIMQRIPDPVKCGERRLDFSEKTLVMGIINTTLDSFSGDGIGSDVSSAVEQARQFVAAGVDIIDVGGQSTRPGSEEVSVEEEIGRVAEPIAAISEEFEVPVSIDTSRPEVAGAALEAGATFINDVYALRRDGMVQVAAESGAGVCLMHMQGEPRTMQADPQYEDLMSEVYDFLAARSEALVAGGVAETQIMIDPGFGFGKTVQHNLEIVRRLRELKSLGRPILIGPSRKSTIGKVLGEEEPEGRLWGTAAVCALSIANGAAMIRVHDVAEMVQTARMADAVLRGWGE